MYSQKKDFFRILSIGYIRRKNNKVFLDIKDEYILGLKELNNFSHLQVLWWFDRFDSDRYRKTVVCNPPYDAPETGVFACRSPIRPNPIALTTVKILDIDFENGIISINNIDAKNNSPIIDLKGYFPVCDRVKNYSIPPWAKDWGEWYPEEGLNLED
jgi:tRNA-Thr(GGU) m(6)t(6)A37 methyltransferase TsaA